MDNRLINSGCVGVVSSRACAYTVSPNLAITGSVAVTKLQLLSPLAILASDWGNTGSGLAASVQLTKSVEG